VALVSAVLAFLPGVLDPFMPPKAALLRLLGLPLLAWALLEWDADRRSPQGAGFTQPLDLAVIAWVAASVLATFTSAAPHLSLLGEITQREGVLTTLALAGLYAGARRTHSAPAARAGTLAVLAAALAAAALYALVQLAGFDPLAWEGVARYPAGAFTALRPGSSVGNANLLGVLMAAGVALLAAQLARGTSGLAWRGPALAAMSVALVATLSRGAWLAAACGLGVALVPVSGAGDAAARARVRVAAVLALVPAAAWALLVARAGVLARAGEAFSGHATSGPARLTIAQAALTIARAHPLTGGGPDTFRLLFPALQDRALAAEIGMPLHAHSVVLQVLATLGLIGIIAGAAWCAALTLTLRDARVQRAQSDLAAPTVALAAAGVVNVTGLAGAAVFVTLSALAACAAVPVPDIAYVAARPPSRARRISLVLAGLLVAEALAQAIPEMRALREAAITRAALTQPASDAASRAASIDMALTHSASMVARPPADDEIWRWRAVALLAAAQAGSGARYGTLGEAEAAAAKACALVPRRAENQRCRADAHALLQASVTAQDSLTAPSR
jgi:O-antigen ligase